jgi:sulfate adenylyltransferase subunit 2
LLHIDSTWEFQDLLAFRDAFAASYGFQLIIESNEDGRAQGLWTLFNWRRAPGQTIRAFRLSNWTERDLWEYIVAESIPLAPLYFASKRNVIEHEDVLIVLDEPERLRWPGKSPRCEKVRFRTLGCWPVTGAIPSTAETSAGILADLSSARTSERTGRVSDRGSLEGQKRDGYF